MRSLRKLVWLEIKIFAREPLGLIGTVLVPVAVFVMFGRLFGADLAAGAAGGVAFVSVSFPVFIATLIALNAVLSLVTIIAIYREGGILKRLRSTPLGPAAILGAHVIVKLIFTAATLVLMVLAGRRYYPVDVDAPLAAFLAALLFVTASIVSIGFVIASLVPTARFAQPVAAVVMYPMIALSGLFVPIEALPMVLRVPARALPLTYAVSLLEGVWTRQPWTSYVTDVAALAIFFVVCTAVATRVFRWE